MDIDDHERCLKKIRELKTTLFFSNPFGWEDSLGNDLVREIEEKLKILEDYIEIDLERNHDQ